MRIKEDINKININIKSNQVKQNILEVLVSLNLKPTMDNFEKINTKIDFANLFAILSMNEIENLFSSRSFELSSNLDATVGINVIEIITEINTDTEIAMPISLNNCPTGKSNNKIGMNTTTVVNAEPRIGAQTCLEPLYDAIAADIPDCFNLYIFSWLTIEASTTIPLTTKLFVPADYDTIQHAFSTPITDDGDSIIVSPGEYNGSLGVLGKNVVIKSTHGFTSTSIIADDYFRCVNINKGVLQGFLITGGFRYYKDGTSNVGGGVYASGSAILKNNYII